MARIDFYIQEVRPFSGTNQTLPQGFYDVEIVAERIVDFRDGRSQGLALDYCVLTGQYKGQRIRDVLNLWHVNTDAVSMARSRLVAIAAAVGIQDFADTADLRRRPFRILLSTRLYNGREYNNVDEYLSASAPVDGAIRNDSETALTPRESVPRVSLPQSAPPVRQAQTFSPQESESSWF